MANRRWRGPQRQRARERRKRRKKKQTRTWLLVHADIEFRNLTGPLVAKKVTNNADRKKARQEQMRDLLMGQETIEKVIPALRKPYAKVWYRRFGEKMAPQLVTISEAYELAKADGEWNQIAVLKSSASNPPIPDHIRGVENDGVIPCWSMNPRDVLEALYDKDTDQVKGNTTKEIQMNSTITPDDLLRKVQQAIEFLFEGSTVRMQCSSAQVKRLSAWVDNNTYFSADEIRAQTTEALTTGKLDVGAGGKGGSKAVFQVAIAEAKLKQSHPQKEGEADHAYKMRIGTLVEQERVQFEGLRLRRENEAKQKQQMVETRLNQALEKVSGDLKIFQNLLAQERATAQKTQKEISMDKSHLEYKEVKALKGSSLLPRFQKVVGLLNKQIESIEKEVAEWTKAVLNVKKGMPPPAQRPTPYTRIVGTDGKPLSAAAATAANRKASQEAGLDYSIMTKVVMGGGKNFSRINGDGEGDDDGGDEGNDGMGGGDEPAEDKYGNAVEHGAEDGEEKLETRNVGKLSKKQMEQKQLTLHLEKLTAKERVQHLANVMAKQTYEPIGLVVDILGKISTIMQMERDERKKKGMKLNHDEMAPEDYTKLSNKDKKRYDAKMTAIRSDPNSALKLEIDSAVKLFQKGKYIYNDAVVEQQTRKPFWCSHDGGATPNDAKQKATLTLTISKNALQSETPKKM